MINLIQIIIDFIKIIVNINLVQLFNILTQISSFLLVNVWIA